MCLTMAADGKCTKCYGTYYGYTFELIADKCVSCQQQKDACSSCSFDATGVATACTKCDSYHRINAGDCQRCDDDSCVKCDSAANICTECEDGYYLKTNVAGVTECLRCPDNCKKCNKGKCTECYARYGNE